MPKIACTRRSDFEELRTKSTDFGPKAGGLVAYTCQVHIRLGDVSVQEGEMTTKRWTRHTKEGWRRGQLESLKLMSKSQVSATVRVLILATSTPCLWCCVLSGGPITRTRPVDVRCRRIDKIVASAFGSSLIANYPEDLLGEGRLASSARDIQ